MVLRRFLRHLINQNFLLRTSRRTLIFLNQVSLPSFSCRINLKLYNILATPKLVKKVITSFDLLKASGPDYIPVVVLKKCDPEFS